MTLSKKSANQKRIAEPIQNPDDLKQIRSNLKSKPRDLLLFDLATQTGLGMKEMLHLKVKHLLGIKVGEKISNTTNKNGKQNNLMTGDLYQTFNQYLEKVEPKPDDYLFKSMKGQRPLNLSSVSNMINSWFEAAHIKNAHGATSLRKTWQYHSIKNQSLATDASSIMPLELFKPIKTKTAQETVFEKLLEAIITGKIPPGARLTTAEISEAFNVSQAPVRVALNWLEAKGFITSKKKRASIVKELSIEELKEIMRIRLILETAAAKLSYKVCTEETLKLAESIIQQTEKVYILEEHDKLNTQFHQILFRDSRMPLLLQLISDLCAKVSPYIILFHSVKDRSHRNDDVLVLYHRQMIEGMRRRDLKKVIKNITLDLNKATAELEEILAKRKKRHSEE